MLGLNDILIALGGVLAIIVALHAYTHWPIRNIDNNTETTNREETWLTRSDLTARPGDLLTIPVREQDVPPRHR
jgi:hypothetical protein